MIDLEKHLKKIICIEVIICILFGITSYILVFMYAGDIPSVDKMIWSNLIWAFANMMVVMFNLILAIISIRSG